ncbi:MAG: sodium-dependent transporter [Cardiobacteriales bacterium]|nr:MAG: sodium-dependent transporter [Cardiobacteriales bacterium]
MSEPKVWAKKSTFIFAAAGSAIGLGNLWKFPYMVGENGGGAFVLVYLLCVLLIGIPLMMSESIVGKYSHGNAIDAISQTAKRSNASQHWRGIAIFSMVTIFIILSFYSVIAGWAFDYTYAFATGEIGTGVDEVGKYFGELLGDSKRLIIWHSVFMLLTAVIIARGAQEGIEKALGVMMPVLFVLLFIVVAYSAFATGKFGDTLTYMFNPDFSKITPVVVIKAMGQAFFSLSLGMCVIMTYAAYMRKDVSITESSLYVSGLDTVMALLAGLAIFPIVFANGLDSGSGPGLLFVTLSTAFSQLGTIGVILGVAFFFLVIIAALSSSISMVEPFVKWCEEHNINRIVATFAYCLAVWAFGLITVYSFNDWSVVEFFGTEAKPFLGMGKSPFDALDFLTSSVFLPLGGLLTALYVGWAMNKMISREQLFTLNGALFGLWLFIMRFVAPIMIGIIFVFYALGEETMNTFIAYVTNLFK